MRSKINFFNPILQYSIKDYENVFQKYLLQVEKNVDVISIYQVGQISTPGISDIDLVIILKDKIHNFTWNAYSVTRLDNKDRYFFMHEPFVINESLARYINILYPFTKINHIYGKTFEFYEPSNEDYLHFFIQEYLRGCMFSPDLLGTYIDLRKVIPFLYSMTYSINIFNLLFKNYSPLFTDKFSEYIENITNLKKNYFLLQEKEIYTTIPKLISDIKKIIKMMFEHVDMYIETNIKKVKSCYVYTGFIPWFVIFNSFCKYNVLPKTRLRLFSPNFSIILPCTKRKLDNNNLYISFSERFKLITSYEEFIYTNNLNKFLMLSNIHSKIGWRFCKGIYL